MFIAMPNPYIPKPQRGDMCIMLGLRRPHQRHISDYTGH